MFRQVQRLQGLYFKNIIVFFLTIKHHKTIYLKSSVWCKQRLIPNIFKVCSCLDDSHDTITIPIEDINKLNVNDEVEIVLKNDEKKYIVSLKKMRIPSK
jgi:hypothetical protein